MRTLFLLLCSAALAACSGGGCSGVENFPDGGRFEGQKIDDAMSLRISPNGFGALSANWEAILDYFVPGKQIVAPLRCRVASVSLLGNFVIADEGSAGCTSEACGQLDGQCDWRDEPKYVTTTFNSMSLAPKAPDAVEVTLDATIQTGKIMIDSVSRSHGLCLFSDPVKCGLIFDTERANELTNVFKVAIKIEIDTRWDRVLRFSVDQLGGSLVCGSANAPARPECLDPNDVQITTEGDCKTCGAADFGPVKSFVLGQVVGELQSTITQLIEKRTCRRCSYYTVPCPQIPGATSSCTASAWSSTPGVCMDDATQECVPADFGATGRMPLGAYLAPLSAPPEAKLDFAFGLGGSASSDTGLNLGIRGGTQGTPVSNCVAPLPGPLMGTVIPPNFDLDAPGPYDVGLSLSRQSLDGTLYETRQSGALCLDITRFDSGLFRPVLPSLGKLIGTTAAEVPMLLSVRPKQVPHALIGRGTYDPVTNKPLDPLLRLELPELAIEFYAQLEDRYVRLFSLTADLSLPISLAVEGCTGLVPVIGDMAGAVTNVHATNSELLAEDLTVLEALVPTFISLAEPQMAGALPGFSLPSFGLFKLQLLEARGVGLLLGAQNYEHLGVYANLLRSNASCAVSAPSLKARLLRSELPDLQALRRAPLPWPKAILAVKIEGATGNPEYSVRVGRGFWSEFRPADAPGELVVSHPAFLLQARHEIEVRARLAKAPTAFSPPVKVGFTVDLEAPVVKLEADREHDRLLVDAKDSMTPSAALAYAYRVAEAPWSSFGPSRVVSLSEIEAAGEFSVRVRDEAGRTTEATYRTPTVELRAQTPAATASAAGCTAAPGALSLFALALALKALVRKRR